MNLTALLRVAKTGAKFLRRICRIPLQAITLVLLLTMAHAATCFAQGPALATVVPIDLPDGQVGELRLFHGDGVFVADPVRLIVLDAAGRLIGFSHETYPISIICSAERKCVGYAHRDGVILEYDPTAKFQGPVITDGVSAGLWFGPHNTIASMRARAPTSAEFAAASLQIAKDNYTDIVFVAIVGVLIGILALVLMRFGVRGKLGFAVRVLIWIAVLGLELLLLFASFAPVFAGAISIFFWLLALGFGALCVVFAWLMLRLVWRMHRQPASA